MRYNEAVVQMQLLEQGTLEPPPSGSTAVAAGAAGRGCRTASGGALRECGTHYLFAIHEIFGHGCVKRVRGRVDYADGAGGIMAETAVEATLELDNGLQLAVSVSTDGTGLAADGNDHYVLEVEGGSGQIYQLHDFVCLRKRVPSSSASSTRHNGSAVTRGVRAKVRHRAVLASRAATRRRAQGSPRARAERARVLDATA